MTQSNYDWRYENSILSNKEHCEVDKEEKYVPGRTNKVLSNHIDTIIHANMMNLNSGLDHDLQYEYLFNSIRAKKRYFKRRKESNFTDISLICEYYKYNHKAAEQAMKVLTKEQINEIKKRLEKGGVL